MGGNNEHHDTLKKKGSLKLYFHPRAYHLLQQNGDQVICQMMSVIYFLALGGARVLISRGENGLKGSQLEGKK